MNKKRIAVTAALIGIFLSSCGTQEPAEIKDYGSGFKGGKATKKGIPLFSKYERKAGDYRTVEVQSGDTLYDIARRYDTPSREIINKNGLTPPYNLQAGEKLKISYPIFHTVDYDETLYGISRQYGFDISSLVKLNGLEEPYEIKPGQRLRLPYQKDKSGFSSDDEKSWFSKYLNKKAKPSPEKTYKKDFSKAEKSIKKDSYEKPASSWNGKFIWPVKGKVISGFGAKKGGIYNDGINIKASEGSNVKAAADGRVIYAGSELRGYGNMVIIRHDDGWITAYAHQRKNSVKKGQWVKKGQVIGQVGSSGNVDRPQLHFAIRKGRKVEDPKKFLSS